MPKARTRLRTWRSRYGRLCVRWLAGFTLLAQQVAPKEEPELPRSTQHRNTIRRQIGEQPREQLVEDLRARGRRESPGYREGYAEAQRAFLIGQAVRERRLALGLSQVELATGPG